MPAKKKTKKLRLKTIKKIGITPRPPRMRRRAAAAETLASGTLELSVMKKGGPVSTSVEVGSSGDDDRMFSDQQLTSGTAKMPLLPGNTYTVVWQGAFVKPGTAVLHVEGNTSQGHFADDVTAQHPPLGDVFTLVVL
jgi:hypothetical protein